MGFDAGVTVQDVGVADDFHHRGHHHVGDRELSADKVDGGRKDELQLIETRLDHGKHRRAALRLLDLVVHEEIYFCKIGKERLHRVERGEQPAHHTGASMFVMRQESAGSCSHVDQDCA